MSGGAQANIAGAQWEDRVAEVIARHTGASLLPRESKSLCELWENSPHRTAKVERQIRLRSNRRWEIIATHPAAWPYGLLVECKYQKVSGTTKEKAFYQYIQSTFWEYPKQTRILMVLGGPYFEKGSAGNKLLAELHKASTKMIEAPRMEVIIGERDLKDYINSAMAAARSSTSLRTR